MIRSLIVGLALAFAISGISYAGSEPQYSVVGPNSPPAPHAFAIISCRADDLTGKPGRHGVDASGHYDPTQAAKNWRDLELHVVHGELECRRELTPVYDQAEQLSKEGTPTPKHDFGDPVVCLGAATTFMAGEQWEVLNKAWVVIAVGCPVPVVDQAGVIIGWHLPECPAHIPGLEGMKCNFDDSAI